eukprot:1522477-Rhodomonas_salina.1
MSLSHSILSCVACVRVRAPVRSCLVRVCVRACVRVSGLARHRADAARLRRATPPRPLPPRLQTPLQRRP